MKNASQTRGYKKKARITQLKIYKYEGILSNRGRKNRISIRRSEEE